MERQRWKNPYIARLTQLPNYIVHCESKAIRPRDIAGVRERCDDYTRVYCEIGSGSGGHLIERAARDPEALYIGFELRYKRTFRTAEKAKARGVHNLLVVRANASFLAEFFPAESLDGIYINFPDPWAKKKWKKNRIINEVYLGTLHKLLKPDGFLSYKTDHVEYFRSSLEVIRTMPNLYHIKEETEDLHHSPYEANNIHTEFEKLFKSQGLSPCYVKAEKSPG